MPARPAAGGGRWVEVDPARLRRWLDGFAARHGVPEVTAQPYGVLLRAPDGAVAECHTPPGAPATGPLPTDLAGFVAAAGAPRLLGLLLIRRGGYAVGLADPTGLRESKVDTGYVQSRTAAGGWSQQRFARRRENQAKALAGSAADTAVRVLLPHTARIAAVVCGGDRALADQVLADARLGPLRDRRDERFLDTPDPRLAVLRDAVPRARAVRIRIDESASTRD